LLNNIYAKPISTPYLVAEIVSVGLLVLTSEADELGGACSVSFLIGPLETPIESADMFKEKQDE
jgi:hypothetical protein